MIEADVPRSLLLPTDLERSKTRRQRSRLEKRRRVIRLLQDPEWKDWSDSFLAKKAEVSQRFVSGIRRSLTQNILSSEPRRGADGVIRNVACIGRRIQETTTRAEEIFSSGKVEQLLIKISQLANEFPKFRPDIEELADQLRHQLTRDRETDRRLVLHAIHCGAWTREELLHDTAVPPKALKQILSDLVHQKIIITKKKQQTTTTGGPPQILYLPNPNHIDDRPGK